jgi:hypothetical protein
MEKNKATNNQLNNKIMTLIEDIVSLHVSEPDFTFELKSLSLVFVLKVVLFQTGLSMAKAY